MADPVDSSSPVPDGTRLYTISWISGAAFVGGPLAAAYLLAHNFKALGQPEHARRVLYGALAVLVMVLGTLALLPPSLTDTRWMQLAISSLWTSAAWFLVEQYQSDAIRAHLGNDGAPGSWARAIAATLGGLAVTVALSVLIFSVAPPFAGTRYDVPGTRGTIYYSGIAEESDARVLGYLLVQAGYYQEPGGVARLVGEGDRLDVWLSLDPAVWDDPLLSEEVDALAVTVEERTGHSTQVTAFVEEVSGRRTQVIRPHVP